MSEDGEKADDEPFTVRMVKSGVKNEDALELAAEADKARYEAQRKQMQADNGSLLQTFLQEVDIDRLVGQVIESAGRLGAKSALAGQAQANGQRPDQTPQRSTEAENSTTESPSGGPLREDGQEVVLDASEDN